MAQRNEVLYIRYTDGTAARKIEPVVPQASPVTHRRVYRRRKTVIYLDPVAFGSILVAGVLLAVMITGMISLKHIHQEQTALQTYIQQLQEENEAQKDAYWDGIDLQEVEQTAKALGMIPASQAQSVSIAVDTPLTVHTPTLWERLCEFWSGLFA